jgi:hypothetical protein
MPTFFMPKFADEWLKQSFLSMNQQLHSWGILQYAPQQLYLPRSDNLVHLLLLLFMNVSVADVDLVLPPIERMSSMSH